MAERAKRAAKKRKSAKAPSREQMKKQLILGARYLKLTRRFTSKMLRVTEGDLKLRLR